MIDNSYLKELTLVKRTIEEVFQLETHLIEPSEMVNLNSLICVLPKITEMTERSLSFTFLPFWKNETDEIKLLQFFSLIPINSKIDFNSENLKNILLHSSFRTVLGNFSIHNNSEIAMRYVYPISKKMELFPLN